jgi:serine/threonine-protein kinase
MSEVWAATDVDLERVVAVKLLAADADPARFDREARAAAGLAHANVCGLYDYGRADGRRFMVLEYLPGGSLEDRLTNSRPLPDGETARIADEIAAGLAHAHERGVVHRDLKPSNILFDAEGRAKIADFGIARTEGGEGLTEAGTVLGTAAYISPEQAAGRSATPASDVYSFGVILFRMLTGRLPFESPDALAVAAMHRDLPAPPVSDLRLDAPPVLESVAAASLAKSPADRPRDGDALVAELAAGAPTSTTLASSAVTEVIAPPAHRHRGLLVALVVGLVAAGGVGLATAITLNNGNTSVPPTTSPTTAPTTEPPTTEPETVPPPTATTATTSPKETTAPPTTQAPTTEPTTTSEPTTTAATTPVTTAPPTTTAETTTATATTETATTAPATTETVPTTTAAVTTDTVPATTTAPATVPG